MTERYPIGLVFIRGTGPHAKRRDVETIVDIYTTRNNAGEVIEIVYVTTHAFGNLTVTDYKVPESTIARGEILETPRGKSV